MVVFHDFHIYCFRRLIRGAESINVESEIQQQQVNDSTICWADRELLNLQRDRLQMNHTE